MTSTDEAAISPILVTGDAGTDLDTYLYFDGPNPPPGAKPTIIRCSWGGAGLAYGILKQWAGQKASSVVGFSKPLEVASPVFAVWNLKSLEDDFKKKGSDIDKVWRLTHSVNPGLLDNSKALPFPNPETPSAPSGQFVPGIILLQDDAVSFRHPRGAVLPFEASWAKDEMPFVIWKMSPPFCRGELWWKAVAAGVLKNTAVVITLDSLRSASTRISYGISWERTALEIGHELESNPKLADLRAAKHVIVVIHGEGVLWRRLAGERPVHTLIFDAMHLEREASKLEKGISHAYGFTSTFAAALAAGCATAGGDFVQGIRTAIPKGLHAMRLLSILGHGSEVEKKGPEIISRMPGFPFDEIAAVLCQGKQGIATLNSDAFANYAEEEIPYEEILKPESCWSIAQGACRRPDGEPLYGLARRVAVFGMSELRGIPHACFGELLTADRNEIEALRNLKTLIDNYRKDLKQNKPLSLAVFGPPGAGKSFGVKQIAREVLGKTCPILEFNLSQFTEADLAGAFHQVRDAVLKGQLPVVFWDEFDSSSYKWLQLLLAPMNDGKFQEGQLTHPLGRCIFVFAGATSYDMEHFGPPEVKKGVKASPDAANAWKEFELLKGPDFKSRIHGFLDVLGPNPKTVYGSSGKSFGDDISFPLRRAIFLRSMLNLKGNQRLDIDPGLLSALLEVGSYTNGARSFERICLALKDSAKDRKCFLPSDLPSDAVLRMNVKDLAEFKALLARDDAFQRMANQLAPAIHRSFLPLAERNNPNAKPYEELSEESKADNLAAARRIPWLLSLAGLYIADANAKGALTSQQVLDILTETEILERLAEEEHDLWMQEKRQNGWVLGERDNKRHVHNLLIPYKDLPPEQKKKDRVNVRGIPERVELARLTIVDRKPV